MSGNNANRFRDGSSYAAARPDYPTTLIHLIRDQIRRVPAPARAPVLDVGAGTGIFTRQLAAVLGSDIPVIGVEPSASMRSTASESKTYRVVDGLAEALPADDQTIRAVTAATAAHWFDRPRFYKEVLRALVPEGMITIIEYVRDTENSAAASAAEKFLASFGEQRAYTRPPYASELTTAGFADVQACTQSVELRLAKDEFVALVLSSSTQQKPWPPLGRSKPRTSC